MTYKQLEASREARLWIGQIIVPAVMGIGTFAAIPEVRGAIKAKATEIKKNIETKNRKRKIKIVK